MAMPRERGVENLLRRIVFCGRGGLRGLVKKS